MKKSDVNNVFFHFLSLHLHNFRYIAHTIHSFVEMHVFFLKQ